jgi:hypothetical protein
MWGCAVKTRRLIAGASYGPKTLKINGQAFDGAWAKIAHHFQDQPEMEAARLRLANIVLDLRSKGAETPRNSRLWRSRL